MNMLLMQASRYGAASLAALAVDMSLLWLAAGYWGWAYVLAASLSYLAGAVVAYLFSTFLIFKEHRLQNRGAELASFVAIGLLGLAINACVIDFGIRHLGLHVMIAKCVAAACTFVCNFVARRQLLFVRRRGVPIRDLSHD